MRYTLSIVLLLALGLTQQLQAITKHGNYLDLRIGDVNNQTFEALLYYSDREWLYDFDTDAPFDGVTANSGSVESSTDFYMSAPQSMRWNTSQGASLSLNVDVNLTKVWPTHYYISVGLFQEDVPTGNDKRVFKVELLSSANAVVASRNIYMHRGGWNILCSDLEFSSSILIRKIRITQTAGLAGSVLLDNFMISAFQNASEVFMSNGTVEIENPNLTMDKAVNYPAGELTDDEKSAFLTIAEKVIPLPGKVSRISTVKMDEYKNFHAFYNIESKGDYASGKNPLYYWRSVTEDVAAPFIHYTQNEQLCKKMKEIGMAWYQTQDESQKTELGTIMTDLVRLAVTFGDMPNPWYNGRGFADGVYYAKDLLEEAGLLDRATTLIMQQYGVDLVLFNEQTWDNPLGMIGDHGPEFFWQATADHLNTTSKSMMLSVLVGADTPEKARNLKRFASWMDNIALNYSPSVDGTLKPDGSWYHHWGNRFDNYGWVAGWRGATELVWWMSHTPFAVNEETKKRMNHMADVHFDVMDKNGHNGPQDKMHSVPSDGFLNLALAGSPDGKAEIDSAMGSYWLAYPNESSYKNNSSLVSKMRALNIKPAVKQDGNLTLSYEAANIHRRGDWQIFTRGISKLHYHTQYERNGYLFYNIGGISPVKEGEAIGMQRFYGAQLLQRHGDDLENITAGYNFSRAPGVTAVPTDYEHLKQLYYQRGTSNFVGGLSTTNGKGIFVQEFDASKSSSYSSTPAAGLRFKKSYFLFGDDIVLLGSGISDGGTTENVETGLMQESASSGANVLSLADGTVTSAPEYNEIVSSTEVPWMFNSSQSMGLYVFPDQEYQLFKGSQTFGPLTGDIVSTYLKHDKQDEGWYEYIMCLNTDISEMENLEASLQSENPSYKVVQRDAHAHVVLSAKDNSTAYAIFSVSGLQANNGPVTQVNIPCVIMAQHKRSEASLILTVSNPDKRMDKTEANPLGWSLPSEIKVSVSGKYAIVGTVPEGASAVINDSENTTEVTVIVKDGLPTELQLQEDRKKNSLPWVEDFVMADETSQDNGMSSWTMHAFDAQAVGYAYVKDNDFWMSGINCNWESSSIDISEAKDVTLKIALRCDEPKRINSNDSISVYYQLNDEPRQLFVNMVDDFSNTTFTIDGISGDSLKVYVESRSDRNHAAYIIEQIEVAETSGALSSKELVSSAKMGHMSIYPNPSNGKITIQNNSDSHYKRVELLDMTGRTVFFQDVAMNPNSETQIQLQPDIFSGTFILRCVGNGTLASHKIRLVH